MLKISKMADYATLVMVQCALHADHPLSASEIAQQTQLQLPTVSKCLKKLCQAGLLISHRGVQGGYQLARSPWHISAAAIVAAIDGPIALTECSQLAPQCERESHCITRHGWHLINHVVQDALNQVCLAQMMTTAPKAQAVASTQAC